MMNITILVHILKVSQLLDIDTLLCFTDMHSVWVKIQIYSIMQVLLPDVTRLLVVTSRVLFQTLSLTVHFVLQLMEANQKQGVKSSLIHWRNLALFIVLCPVTRLKMDVHTWMFSKHKQWRWCPLKPCRLYCSQKEVSRLWGKRFMCHALTSQQRHAACRRLHFRR